MASEDSTLWWENDRKNQQLWIQLTEWTQRVCVSVPIRSRPRLSFEGIVLGRSPLSGRSVSGEIDIPVEAYYPNPDDDLQKFSGNLFPVGDDGKVVSIVLYAWPEVFKELADTFASFSKNDHGLSLRLWLSHEDGGEPEYWKNRWQNDDIEIGEFEVYGSGSIPIHEQEEC